MSRSWTAIVLLVIAAPLASAQDVPERLLSGDSQIYIRWDGTDRHQDAYKQTALNKVMQGDLGQLLTSMLTDEKQQHLIKLAHTLGSHGLVVGIELRKIDPPEMQLIAVLPDAKTQWMPLFGTLNWVADEIGAPLKEMEVQKRTVYQIPVPNGPMKVAFWKEGKEAVLIVGTDSAADVVKRWDSKATRLTDHPLYKKVEAFKEFKSALRGFVDVAALVKLAGTASPDVGKVLTQLGLDSFKDLTFHYGFDGTATRSVVILEVPGPRKGLARLVGGEPFTLKDLPAMPNDMSGFTALRFDALALWDGSIELIQKLMPPGELDRFKRDLAQINDVLGVNLSNDIIGSLGTLMVTYASPTDGAHVFGQTLALQVKDAKKLEKSLDTALDNLAKASGGQMQVKQRNYRGTTLKQIYVRDRHFWIVPSFALTREWLVIGLYPQPVQGFILRSTGELPAWTPSASVKDSLAKVPAKYNSLSMDDPRTGIGQMLSLAPLAYGLLKSEFGRRGEFPLDLSGVPHQQELTRHLFPSISVASDDGKTWRMETIGSMPLPPGMGRVDAGALLGLGGIAAFGFYIERNFN